MKSDRKKILFEKLINHQCSREELEELLNFKGSSDFDEQFGEVLDKAWENLNEFKEIDPFRGEKIFQDIISKKRKTGNKLMISFGAIYKAAAVFIILLIFSGFVYWYKFSDRYVYESTAYGQTKEIKLSDGSVVTLNGNSSISYKNRWNADEERILTLEGEAFFKITRQSNEQKFVVKARKIKVEVLGTEFNVMSRERASSVVLKSGKVKLAVEGSEDIIMKPGQLVEVPFNTEKIKKSKVNVFAYTSWKDNLLTFQSSTLLEISKTVEETYGVEIEIEDSVLAGERFTGVFPADGNLDDLYSMLSRTYEFKVIKKNEKIIFKK